MNPPAASMPATIATPLAPADTRDVFPHALHVMRPGTYLHHGMPVRSPQNGQLSRGSPPGTGLIVCPTFCRSAVNAERTRDRTTAARSRGRQPVASRHEVTDGRPAQAFIRCNGWLDSDLTFAANQEASDLQQPVRFVDWAARRYETLEKLRSEMPPHLHLLHETSKLDVSSFARTYEQRLN